MQILFCLAIIFIANAVRAQLVVSEVCSKNHQTIVDFEGDTPDFIELKNVGTNTLQLSEYSIMDDDSDVPWVLPNITLSSNQFVLLFATEKNLYAPEFHTNFKLSSEGEYLFLLHNDVTESLQIPLLRADDSYGWDMSSNSYRYFDTPTPSNNNSELSYLGYCQAPSVSLPSGFYGGVQQITCSNDSNNSTLLFATGGNSPIATGQPYSAPLSIDTTTCFRFVSVSSDYLPSEIICKNYFVNEEKQLPVMSITAEPYLLFDPDSGLYIMGSNAEPDWPFLGANFWNNKHILVHAEYFENGEVIFSQPCEMRMHGGKAARTKPQRPLRLIAKKKYGTSHFNDNLIPQKEHVSYKKIVLRNGGSDWNNIHFTDGFIQRITMSELFDLDCKGSEPVIVYINGEYFGVHDFQEKIDENFCINNGELNEDYGVTLLEDEDIDLIGNHQEFDAMVTQIASLDLSEEVNYQLAASMLDIRSFADYMIAELFWNNYDWPANNVKYYKSDEPGSKWRFIAFDFDVSMNSVGFVNEYSNNLVRMLSDFTDKKLVVLFQALMENEEYYRYFLNRYADLVNTVLSEENLTNEFTQLIEYVEPEMYAHFNRWGSDVGWWWYYWLTPKAFVYLSERPAISLNQLEEYYVLHGQHDLQIDTWPAHAGRIDLNSLHLDSLPWSGTYFHDVSIDVKANPHFGYTFSHWLNSTTGEVISEEPSMNKLFEENTQLVAVFEGTEGFDDLFIYPNPASEHFSIGTYSSINQQAEVLVFDLSGSLISSEIFVLHTGINELNYRSKLATGCYELVLKTETETKQGRLMIVD